MVSRTLLSLAFVTVLLLSGCTDGDRPDATPGTSPANSGSTEDAASGSPPAGTPEVEAATGPVIEGDVFSFHLPADGAWELRRRGLSATAYDDELNAYDVATSEVPLQAGDTGEDLDFDYETSNVGNPFDQPLVRGENRVLDGIEGWTAQTTDNGNIVYVFGGMHDRHAVKITLSFVRKDPRSREWIEATLASLQWK